jgi:flavin prenyltransferase
MKKTDGLALVLAATGASGSSLTKKFLKILLKNEKVEKVHFVASDSFEDVLFAEEGQSFPDFIAPFAKDKKFVLHDCDDVAAPVSSGTYPHNGMVILPLSMSSLGAIATGAHRDLAHRAADVCLKEGRKLIVCPRESPLSLIHLRNLTAIKEAGAVIMPFMPAYYTKPKTIEDLENHFFQKILDHLGLENKLSPRWGDGK